MPGADDLARDPVTDLPASGAIAEAVLKALNLWAAVHDAGVVAEVEQACLGAVHRAAAPGARVAVLERGERSLAGLLMCVPIRLRRHVIHDPACRQSGWRSAPRPPGQSGKFTYGREGGVHGLALSRGCRLVTGRLRGEGPVPMRSR